MDENTLLQTLKFTPPEALLPQFLSHLSPFSSFANLSFHSNPNTKEPQELMKTTPTLVRPLANRFLSFLTKCIQTIPNLLNGNLDSVIEAGRAVEILKIYRLVIECFEVISICLKGGNNFVDLERGMMILCLDKWGEYMEAEREGLRLIHKLNFGKEDVLEEEMIVLGAKIVACVVGCAWKRRCMDRDIFRRNLELMEMILPLLRVLNTKSMVRCRDLLTTSLYRSTLFLAKECFSFDSSLVRQFCQKLLKECSQQSSVDHFKNVAYNISRSVDKSWEGRPFLFHDMLNITLKGLYENANLVKNAKGFLEIVSYFVKRLSFISSTSTNFFKDASETLYKYGDILLLVSPPLASILNLYATGLYSKAITDTPTDVYPIFIRDVNKLQILSDSLGVLARYVDCTTHGKVVSEAGVKQNKSSIHVSEFIGNNSKQLDGIVYMFPYSDALEYFCSLSVEYVNKLWEYFVSQDNQNLASQDIRYIQDAFHQFCDLIGTTFKHTSEVNMDQERSTEYRNTMLRSVVSVLKISAIDYENLKRSISFFESIISSAWIKPKDLKYLASAVGNVGAQLYNTNQLKRASLVLELRCKLICLHVKITYGTYIAGKKGSTTGGLTEDEVRAVIVHAFKNCALLVDCLHRSGFSNVCDIVVKCLIDLSAGYDMIPSLSASLPLVKQWVKMLCRDYNNNDDIEKVPCLYPLLNNCPTLKQKTLGKILEQELLSHALMESQKPDLCKKMQSKVIDTLLNNVLTTKECKLQRSRVLVWKGRALRAYGVENLDNCIKCLRVAILLLEEASGEPSESSIAINNQLALTYLLAAQCSQEANADFEVVLNDIGSAVELLSSIDKKDQYADYRQIGFSATDTVLLLCNIADLLSVKGCWDLQFHICKLIFIILEHCEIPVYQRLAILWSERRLNHSLCFSPISEDSLLFMSQHLGDQANSIEFWNHCFLSNSPSHAAIFQKFLPCDEILPELCVVSSYFFGNIAVNQVESVASSLISDTPPSSQSASIFGHLYHDLAERLFSGGRLFEALRYARTALWMRKRMLHGKFTEQVQLADRNETPNQRVTVQLEMKAVAASNLWPDVTRSVVIGNSIITPWSILRSYLESILQVGVINESIGNGGEAKEHFQNGNTISSKQKLPIFHILFTSLLGQLYRKEQLWDLAENELNNARKLLEEYDSNITCERCKVAFEVFIDTQFGDLYRECPQKNGTLEFSSIALDAYQKAVDKLSHDDLVSSLALYDNLNTQIEKLNTGKSMRPVKHLACSACSLISVHAEHAKQTHSEFKEVKELNSSKGIRKSSRILSKQRSKENRISSEPKTKSRVSKKTSQNKSTKCTNGVDSNDAEFPDSSHCSDTFSLQRSKLTNNEGILNLKCWRCLLIQVAVDGNIKSLSYLKWEYHRRRLVLQLYLKIANCKENHSGENTGHEVHSVYMKCASLMLIGHPSCCKDSNVYEACLAELIQGDSSTNIFPAEKAALLYNMGWFILKSFHSGDSRLKCCTLSTIRISDVARWLLFSFIHSRQLPLLFQKVSRLLACILLVSTISGHPLEGFFDESSLCTSQWAAFFHQISIGTYLPCQYLNFLKDKTMHPNVSEDRTALMLDAVINESNLLRFAPDRLEQLDEFVKEFYESLPSVPVICVSLLEGDYARLIGTALPHTSVFPAWMLLSRFDFASQPISLVLPVDQIVGEEEFPLKSVEWNCPWSYSVVDTVAPVFKKLLEASYSSTKTVCPEADKKKYNVNWWSQRSNLDRCLAGFLKSMEDSWLGPWACLLLGKRLEADPIFPKVIKELKHHFHVEANESLISAVLHGSNSVGDAEACFSQMISYKGCFGSGACFRKETRTLPESVRKLVEEAVGKSDRDAVMLVLDSDVQMLPWESMPSLCNQEMYRMPSVNSISFTIKRCLYNNNNDQVCSAAADRFPRVNPADAYYLLNPDGDLGRTQSEFEEWFRNEKWEGESGRVPSAENLVMALKKHNLFLYFGHGSGMQYIPKREVQKLDKCAAALLMGCSSGALLYRGEHYAPHGTPVSFLFGGSPAVIGNLWDVTDKDIDRFGKAMLQSWLQEEPCCCAALVEELGSLELVDAVSGGRRSVSEYGCQKCTRKRIASFMSRARGTCKLPSLIGAAPVCYGVPTFVLSKSKRRV